MKDTAFSAPFPAASRNGGNLESRLLFALLAFLPLVFGPFLSDTFALPKVTVLRLGTLLLLAWIARDVPPFGRGAAEPRAWRGPILAWGAAVTASALAAEFKSVAFWGFNGFFVDGWTSTACYLVLFWIVAARLSDRAVEFVPRVMVGAGGFVAAYALLQASGFDLFVWKYGQAVFNRPWSTLGNPNYLGAYLAMILPLAGAGLARRPNAVNAALLALPVAVLPFTSSQAAWGGAVVGLAVWAAWDWSLVRKRAATLTLAAALGALLCVGVGMWRADYAARLADAPPPLAPDISTELNPSGAAVFGRLHMWKAALRMWRHRPLLGVGPDGFVYPFKRRVDPAFEDYVGQGLSSAYAHNAVLNVAATLGALGLAAYAWLGATFGLAVRRLFRVRASSAASMSPESAACPRSSAEGADALAMGGPVAALTAVWTNNLFSFHNVTTAVYAWVLLGILARAACPRSDTAGTADPARSARRLSAAVRIAMGLLAAAGVAACGASLLANRHNRRAEEAFDRRGDWRAAVERSRKAVALNPFSSAYRIRLARMLQEGIFAGRNDEERLRCYEESVREYKLQTEKTPGEPLAQNGLGVTYIRGGMLLKKPDLFEEAEQRFQLALENDPLMTEALSNLANVWYLQGRRGEAVKLYEKAIVEHPRAMIFPLNLGDIHAAEGRLAEAVRQWQNVLRKDPKNREAQERMRRVWEQNP